MSAKDNPSSFCDGCEGRFAKSQPDLSDLVKPKTLKNIQITPCIEDIRPALWLPRLPDSLCQGEGLAVGVVSHFERIDQVLGCLVDNRAMMPYGRWEPR